MAEEIGMQPGAEPEEDFTSKEEELVSHLSKEAQQAVSAADGSLAEDVQKALDYYLGKPYGNEIEGQSVFVTREVLETIEGMMPYLMKVFFSSDKACQFEPEDADDIDGAEQETEYVNWVFYRQNKGFKIGYSWIKDALLSRLGIVKAVREGQFQPKPHSYENQTEEAVGLLLSQFPDGSLHNLQVIPNPETGLFSVSFTEYGEGHSTKIYNVPPENFGISDSDMDVQTAHYTFECYEKTISDLRDLGFDVPDDIADSGHRQSAAVFGTVKTARTENIDDNGVWLGRGRDRESPERVVLVWEEYVYYDFNEDGFSELLKVIRVGDTVLERTEVECRPYYVWSPVIVPHRFIGLSIADLVMDIQLLKSQFTRNILDNQRLTNNGRYAVVDGQVNLDDLMSSSAHGIVRENFKGAVTALDTPNLGPGAYDVLKYADSMSEKRAGVSERSSGLDPKQYNSNTTATSAERVMDAAEQKVELIARIFAECGLKELFLGVHKLGLQFEEPGVKIRNNNGEFTVIDPQQWRNRSDMTVTVGIGNGSKTHQMMQMQAIGQNMLSIAQQGGMKMGIITPTDIYNFAVKHAETLGRKDANLFFSKPESDQMNEEPPLEDQVKMMEAQIKQMQAQTDAQEAAQKLEIDAAKQLLDEERLELEKQKQAFAEKRWNDEIELRLMEAQIELKFGKPTRIGPERESKKA